MVTGNYQKVLEEIDKLKSMMPGLFPIGRPDWKPIWDQIRVVGTSFKGVRFPSSGDHQQAWGQFQSIVDEVKSSQEEEHKQWEDRKSKSNEHKNGIMAQAEMAKPSGPMGDLMLTIATGGLSVVLSTLMGQFDERKRELETCGEHLRQGWALFKEYKDEMLGRDRTEAYSALAESRDVLNQAWDSYRNERQRAYEDHQTERQRKHGEWVARVEANIQKNEARRDKLLEIIHHKEDHLSELHDKLNDAWSDSFRDTCSGWIDEEEAKLEELRSQLGDVEGWLQEDRNKLSS